MKTRYCCYEFQEFVEREIISSNCINNDCHYLVYMAGEKVDKDVIKIDPDNYSLAFIKYCNFCGKKLSGLEVIK